jgi:hypothetical protein
MRRGKGGERDGEKIEVEERREEVQRRGDEMR